MGHAELEPEDIDQSISPLRGAAKRTWCAFCNTTSIHGFKFINDAETNKIVRYVWILITLVSFICAIVMVSTFYSDYRSNPTRMNVENDHAPVTSIYFPAITVCSDVLMNIDKAQRYIATLKLPSNSTTQQVVDSLAVNYGFVDDEQHFSMAEISRMQSLLELNNLTIIDFLQKIRYSCKEMIVKCRFQSKIEDCDELFQVSRTFYGYCCSFNLNQRGIKFTARNARGGLQDGLSLMLSYNFTDTRSYTHGFKVLIHETDSYPGGHAGIKFVPANQEVFITMEPTEVFCSEAVKQLSFEERQCYFRDEQVLEHVSKYVGSNCILNYRVTNMIKFCGCNSFFFQHAKAVTRTCTYKDIPCLEENFADIIGRYRNTQATCPNTCENFHYEVDLTTADLQLDMPTVDRFYDGITANMSVAHIFMNSMVYRRIRHDLLSNTVTLVSNLGSAFSLFVGVSMVSIVEIFFYCTVIFRKFYLQELKAREKILFKSTKTPPTPK